MTARELCFDGWGHTVDGLGLAALCYILVVPLPKATQQNMRDNHNILCSCLGLAAQGLCLALNGLGLAVLSIATLC